MVVQLVLAYWGMDTYNPKKYKDTEMAVVVTGSDSGFGKEIAFWAADAGFTVFAGCRLKESFQDFADHAHIHPVMMDVTSDTDVDQVVTQVQAWLNDEESTKQRVLHGLINNAGIFLGLDADLTELSMYQKVMDGTSQSYLGTLSLSSPS